MKLKNILLLTFIFACFIWQYNHIQKFDSYHIPPAPTSVNKKRIPLQSGRIISGSNIKQYKDSQAKIPMINQIDPDWPKKVRENLLRHRHPDSKVSVRPIKGYIKVKNNKGRYVEKVLVDSTSKDGEKFSFHAIIDSQSGKILSTFNHTIKENFLKQNKKLQIKIPITN